MTVMAGLVPAIHVFLA